MRKIIRDGIELGNAFGPILFNYTTAHSDICITEKYNKKNICIIDNNGYHRYECHPQYKCSLFVNTAGPLEKNYCTILDYEVYTHNCSFSPEFPIFSLFRLLDTQFHKTQPSVIIS